MWLSLSSDERLFHTVGAEERKMRWPKSAVGLRERGTTVSPWAKDRNRCAAWSLTLWRPLLPHGYSFIASYARPGWAVICNFWHPGTLTLSPERQSALMSKITNDGSIRSVTGCYNIATIWQQWASKGWRRERPGAHHEASQGISLTHLIFLQA